MTSRPVPSGGFWRRLYALTRKEVRQLLRDRSNLMMGLALPMALIVIFGYGMTFDIQNAPVAVAMEDRSPVAYEAIAGLMLSDYFSPIVVGSMREAESLMRQGDVDAIVHVSADFSRELNRGDAQVQVLVHGANANRARSIQGYIQAALAQAERIQRDRAGDAVGAVGAGRATVVQRLWFNSANTSTWFLAPGLIVVIMTLVGAFLTALVMAREWERGTLEALFVTPVRPLEILLAKIIPYFVVGMMGLGLCLLATTFLFHVPVHGSLLIIILGSMLYLMVALGIGLLISAATRNQFMASQLALLSSFMPALMLSGFLFDLRNMPAVVGALGHALPATFYMELLKSSFLAGDIWPMIFRNCMVLLAYALVLLGAARLKTRKRIE
jgi:ABC-2 type transport system permease protein